MPESRERPALGDQSSSPDWIDAVAQAANAFLRSPAFLEMLKAHLQALVRWRTQQRNQPPSSDAASSPELAPQWDELRVRIEQLEQELRGRRLQLEQTLKRLLGDRELPPIPAVESRCFPITEAPLRLASGPRGVTPYEVLFQDHSWRLLHYLSPRGASDALGPHIDTEPLLICFALVNRPYIMDLQVDRSIVRVLLEQGLDVYLIDWAEPTDADRALGLEDYVCRFLKQAVDLVCQSAGSSHLTLLGYCMGGTLATMFTALYPQRIRNLVLMAAPIDFAGDEGLLHLWARREYFDVDALIDAFGNCPGPFLQYCFQLMRPVQNWVEKLLLLSQRGHDANFLDNFLAMERWANDSVPIAGRTFREYVKWLYQENRLIQDRLQLGRLPVRLGAIDCPVLVLVAQRDHLVPPSSTLSLSKYVRSREVQVLSADVGHIGLAVSQRALRNLWPQAAQWIAEHSRR